MLVLKSVEPGQDVDPEGTIWLSRVMIVTCTNYIVTAEDDTRERARQAAGIGAKMLRTAGATNIGVESFGDYAQGNITI